MSNKPTEQERKLLAVRDIEETDLSFKDIAKKWGLKTSYIYHLNQCRMNWIRELGFSPPLRKTGHDINREIKEHLDNGVSAAKIMEEYNLTSDEFAKKAWHLLHKK